MLGLMNGILNGPGSGAQNCQLIDLLFTVPPGTTTWLPNIVLFLGTMPSLSALIS